MLVRIRRMFRMWVGLLFGCMVWPALLIGPLARAGEDVDKASAAARVADLVRQLGDRSFRVRQQAARSLRQIGLPAITALQNAVKSPDLEVRVRAGQLLEDVEQLELERRLELFLRKADNQSDNVLLGWKRYRESVGGDRVARELFVEMQRAEPKLFRMLELGGKELVAEYETRCVELQADYAHGHLHKTALGSVCTLLFVGSDPTLTVSEQAAGAVYNFAHYNEFRAALSSGEKVSQLRKLLGGWIARPGAVATYQRTRLAMRHNLREGLVPALEVLGNGVANWQLQYAILAVGKLGGREHVPGLEKLLDNQTVLGTMKSKNQPVFTCEVRDVVLAVILHLTGQDPKQYGFERLRQDSQYLFSPNTAGFKSDAARETAFKKWAEWKAANAASKAQTEKSPPVRTSGR